MHKGAHVGRKCSNLHWHKSSDSVLRTGLSVSYEKIPPVFPARIYSLSDVVVFLHIPNVYLCLKLGLDGTCKCPVRAVDGTFLELPLSCSSMESPPLSGAVDVSFTFCEERIQINETQLLYVNIHNRT